MSKEQTHPCGIVGDHVDACLGCGRVTALGWAHHCERCWEEAIAEDSASYEGLGPGGTDRVFTPSGEVSQ